MIASKLYIDESEKGAKLLAQWPLDVTLMKRKVSAKKPRSRDRPRKNSIEIHVKTSVKLVIIEGEEVVISRTKTTSKIYKPESYNEMVNDPVYSHRWREAIEEELQNLKSYQT